MMLVLYEMGLLVAAHGCWTIATVLICPGHYRLIFTLVAMGALDVIATVTSAGYALWVRALLAVVEIFVTALVFWLRWHCWLNGPSYIILKAGNTTNAVGKDCFLHYHHGGSPRGTWSCSRGAVRLLSMGLGWV